MVFKALLSLTLLSLLQRVTPQAPIRVDGQVAAAWYAGWHATGAYSFPPSAVDWSKYNTLIYSFAATAPTVNALTFSQSDTKYLSDIVQKGHQNGVAVHVAIGGWAGSRWFSSNVATAENRTAFADTVLQFAKDHGVDGIEFDWEYPGRQGIGCNTVDAEDTEHFLSFLQTLRENSGDLTITAAVGVTPFVDASGKPSTSVSEFAKVLDYVAIMNYDVWGSWSSGVGPNAPLNDTCAMSPHQQGSAVSAVKAWSTAGMPLKKIVLGVPSYGHSFRVSPTDAFVEGSETELAAYPKFDSSNQPGGDAWDNTPGYDACGVYQNPGGTFNLWGLVRSKFLTTTGDAAPGIFYRYDNCSQTPYVYDKESQVMVAYDNAQSFTAKGKFVKDSGLRGFAMWQAGGDYRDILLNAIGNAAGICYPQC